MISVVVPLHNEAENVAVVVHEIAASLASAGPYEIVLVDDGSTDGTWDVVQRLAAQEQDVAAVRLRRRYGKSTALRAGADVARGAVVVTLDGDGQDDPAEIVKLIAALDDGADVAIGWKQHRRDPLGKRLASRVFNVIVSFVTGVRLRDHNTGLKAMRAEVLAEVPLYGELHRFLAALAQNRGFVIRELPVHHRPRLHGASKYGPGRFVTALLDLAMVRTLVGFEGRSHHLLGVAGFLAFGAGAVGLAWLAWTWIARLFTDAPYLSIASRPLTSYAVAALLFGAQLLSLAFLAGLVAHLRANDGPHYSVRARAGRAATGPA